ncbi:MAG: hypothetical protein M0037_02980 [Betaproteobacteria bacterium]|nr:hypothetical protein [Betaproteobacteria bacterium]
MKPTFRLFACLLSLSALGACSHGSGSTGPSPFPGHDKAWFSAHLKERAGEVKWCNNNEGYINPYQPPHRADQAKTWDPACDAASDSFYDEQNSAKPGPGAF